MAILLVCVACAGDEPEGTERGRLILERAGPDPGVLAELQAAANYCARDTTFSIVASSPEWATAIAVRAPWPVDSASAFDIDSAPGTAGRAAFAARVLRDSVQIAMVGQAGRVMLDPGRVQTGRFEASVLQDSMTVELTGRFEGLTVVERCP